MHRLNNYEETDHRLSHLYLFVITAVAVNTLIRPVIIFKHVPAKKNASYLRNNLQKRTESIRSREKTEIFYQQNLVAVKHMCKLLFKLRGLNEIQRAISKGMQYIALIIINYLMELSFNYNLFIAGVIFRESNCSNFEDTMSTIMYLIYITS